MHFKTNQGPGMTHKGIQIKIKHDMANGLIQLLDEYLKLHYVDDCDKLIMAGLAEVRHRLYIAVERVRKDYTLTLTPVQSLAIRMFYTDFINEPMSYTGNALFLISNEVHKKYA
jgi:hypothetical protein